MDRLVGFLKAGQRTRRTLVVDVYSAYVMHLIRSEVKIPPPTRDEGIRVFYPQHFLSSFERKRLHKIHDLFLSDRIALDEILADPKGHLMLFRPSMLDSDFGGEVPAGTLCLFSRWEGYLEQPEWQTTREKLEAAGGKLVHIHTSGHAYVDDLRALITKINPRKIIPIHTFEPEALRACFDNVVAIDDGEILVI